MKKEVPDTQIMSYALLVALTEMGLPMSIMLQITEPLEGVKTDEDRERICGEIVKDLISSGKWKPQDQSLMARIGTVDNS